MTVIFFKTCSKEIQTEQRPFLTFRRDYHRNQGYLLHKAPGAKLAGTHVAASTQHFCTYCSSPSRLDRTQRHFLLKNYNLV